MPVLVQLGLLFHHKYEINNSLEERIIKEDLVFFEFSEEELESLEWEHQSEFKYLGNMYDIVHRKKKGKSIQLWCYQDDFEKELKEKITRFFAFGFEDDLQKNEKQKKLTHFFKGLFYHHTDLSLEYNTYSIVLNHTYTMALIHSDVSPPHPPPKKG